MSQERLSMRKIKEVLRLRSLGLKQRQIADSCSISQSTVHAYLKAAEAAGKSWPVIADWDDGQLEKALFAQPAAAVQRSPHLTPDFALIHRELQDGESTRPEQGAKSSLVVTRWHCDPVSNQGFSQANGRV